MTDSGYLIEQVVLLCLFGFIFVLNAIQLAVERRMHADVERYQDRLTFEKQISASSSKMGPLPRAPPTVGKLHAMFHRSILLTCTFALLRCVDPHTILGIWDLGATTFFINNCTNVLYASAGVAAVLFVELRYRMMLMHVPYSMKVIVAVLVFLTTIALQASSIQAWVAGVKRRDNGWLHAYMFFATLSLHVVASFQIIRVRNEMLKLVKASRPVTGPLDQPSSHGKNGSVTSSPLQIEYSNSAQGSTEMIAVSREQSDDASQIHAVEAIPSNRSQSHVPYSPTSSSSPSATRPTARAQSSAQAMRDSVQKMTTLWLAFSLIWLILLIIFLVSVYSNFTDRPDERVSQPDPEDHNDALTASLFIYIVALVLIVMQWFSFLSMRVLIAPIDDYGMSESRAFIVANRPSSQPSVLRPLPSP